MNIKQYRKDFMPFNINEAVSVRLTNTGRDIHYRRHVALIGNNYRYIPPETDADGWSEFQMWELMQIFGKHIGIAKENPFELNIKIQTAWRPITEDEISAEEATVEAWGDGP